MYNQKAKIKIEEADQLLQTAQNEMFRSEGDVVPFMACSNARQAISNYLSGFLLQRGVESDELVTIKSLLIKCQEIDSRFRGVELDEILCKKEKTDSKFCTDLDKVRECVQVAKKTKEMINQEIDKEDAWPLSKHVK